jgi:hypothetical protein
MSDAIFTECKRGEGLTVKSNIEPKSIYRGEIGRFQISVLFSGLLDIYFVVIVLLLEDILCDNAYWMIEKEYHGSRYHCKNDIYVECPTPCRI